MEEDRWDKRMKVPAETPDSKHLRRGANKQLAIGQAIITYPGPRVKRASFRVKAVPPPGKKASCNHSTNVSLGPTFVATVLTSVLLSRLNLLHLRFPGETLVQGNKNSYWCLVYRHFCTFLVFLIPHVPLSFSPLCSLAKVSLGLISWPGCWGWIWNLLKGP